MLRYVAVASIHLCGSLSLKGKEGGAEISKNKTRVNATIQAPQLRVIDADGSSLGAATAGGLRLAEEPAVDLVEVAPNAGTPGRKLMDLEVSVRAGQTRKRAAESQKEVEVKEVRLRPKTD